MLYLAAGLPFPFRVFHHALGPRLRPRFKPSVARGLSIKKIYKIKAFIFFLEVP